MMVTLSPLPLTDMPSPAHKADRGPGRPPRPGPPRACRAGPWRCCRCRNRHRTGCCRCSDRPCWPSARRRRPLKRRRRTAIDRGVDDFRLVVATGENAKRAALAAAAMRGRFCMLVTLRAQHIPSRSKIAARAIAGNRRTADFAPVRQGQAGGPGSVLDTRNGRDGADFGSGQGARRERCCRIVTDAAT